MLWLTSSDRAAHERGNVVRRLTPASVCRSGDYSVFELSHPDSTDGAWHRHVDVGAIRADITDHLRRHYGAGRLAFRNGEPVWVRPVAAVALGGLLDDAG